MCSSAAVASFLSKSRRHFPKFVPAKQFGFAGKSLGTHTTETGTQDRAPARRIDAAAL
jgi:hypothetical protein